MSFWKNSFASLLMLGMVSSAWGGWFSCEGGSETPKPDWVSRLDYSMPNFYVGVGAAEKNGKSLEEQRKLSELDAKRHLVEQIEVTIRSDVKQKTQVTNQSVQQAASAEVMVTADEVLRDLKIKDRWVDKESCAIYTLMAIGKESVAQAKREKLMRTRLEKVKSLLADGLNREKNGEMQIRHSLLEEAKNIFAGIDFSLTNEEYGKAAYAEKINTALAEVDKEILDSANRVAVFALNLDGKIPTSVLGQMLDQLGEQQPKVERLMAECHSPDECVSKAKTRGFGTLVMLKVDSKVEITTMGSLKGTLSVSKSTYEVLKNKLIAGPISLSSQVIGWGDDDMNWAEAARKMMRELK
jgi:hypothetical protein